MKDGDEIVAAGQFFHTGAPVVLWTDADGYDASVERCWFTPGRVLPSRPSAGCDVPERIGPRAVGVLGGVTFAVGAAASAPGQMPIEDVQAAIEVLRRATSG